MSDISRDDWKELKEDVSAGFAGMHRRLDEQNGRVRATEVAIAVLQDRGTRDPTARWTAAIGVFVVAVVEAAKQWMGGKP